MTSAVPNVEPLQLVAPNVRVNEGIASLVSSIMPRGIIASYGNTSSHSSAPDLSKVEYVMLERSQFNATNYLQ